MVIIKRGVIYARPAIPGYTVALAATALARLSKSGLICGLGDVYILADVVVDEGLLEKRRNEVLPRIESLYETKLIPRLRTEDVKLEALSQPGSPEYMDVVRALATIGLGFARRRAEGDSLIVEALAWDGWKDVKDVSKAVDVFLAGVNPQGFKVIRVVFREVKPVRLEVIQ